MVDSEDGIRRLRMCTECHYNAPNALIVVASKNEAWKRSYDGKSSADIDCSIITTQMMLTAEALGVGTTWVMYFIPEAVVTEFNIPNDFEPVAILVMGYPAPDAAPAIGHYKKKQKSDIVMYNNFK